MNRESVVDAGGRTESEPGMKFHFDCHFGACLFGVFFDSDNVFYVAFGPFCLAMWFGGENGDEAFA